MVDVHRQIDAVTRALQLTRTDRGRESTLTATQTYAAGIEDVWDAITDPARIARWFMPIGGDLRVGGHYQLEGNAGGTIRECDSPHHLLVTWEYGDEITLVQVDLDRSVDGTATTLRLVHTGPIDESKWNEFGPGATGIGWDSTLLGLSEHLSPHTELDATTGAAWGASAEGKQFMIASGERWRDADIAAGTTAADADGAAQRCIAAYTGAPPPDTDA